jgi:hypothetical protein
MSTVRAVIHDCLVIGAIFSIGTACLWAALNVIGG